MRTTLPFLCPFAAILSGMIGFATPSVGYTSEWMLESVSVRTRLSEKTVLGEDAPEDFEELDVSANFAVPWQNALSSSLGIDMRLMASGGILRGAGDNAMVLSLIPELVLKSEDGRFSLDAGIGGVFTSQYEFGTQDFGGPFQFAITLGATVPLYERFGIGYRFMHYSDAGLNGPGTTGIDFHMIEISYNL